MADIKTKPTKESVSAFLGAIPDERRRKDCRIVAAMMKRATGAPPKMWGARKLDDVDLGVLENLVTESVKHLKRGKSGEAR
jgi:hypothetical protein